MYVVTDFDTYRTSLKEISTYTTIQHLKVASQKLSCVQHRYWILATKLRIKRDVIILRLIDAYNLCMVCAGYMSMYPAIDTTDYVNGIGNCSREQHIRIHDGCALRVMIEVDGFVEFYMHWYFS